MEAGPGAPAGSGVTATVPEVGMGDKIKPLCKWKESQYLKELELLKQIVAEPGFVCSECGRAAGEKQWLCKPVRL